MPLISQKIQEEGEKLAKIKSQIHKLDEEICKITSKDEHNTPKQDQKQNNRLKEQLKEEEKYKDLLLKNILESYSNTNIETFSQLEEFLYKNGQLSKSGDNIKNEIEQLTNTTFDQLLNDDVIQPQYQHIQDKITCFKDLQRKVQEQAEREARKQENRELLLGLLSEEQEVKQKQKKQLRKDNLLAKAQREKQREEQEILDKKEKILKNFQDKQELFRKIESHDLSLQDLQKNECDQKSIRFFSLAKVQDIFCTQTAKMEQKIAQILSAYRIVKNKIQENNATALPQSINELQKLLLSYNKSTQLQNVKINNILPINYKVLKEICTGYDLEQRAKQAYYKQVLEKIQKESDSNENKVKNLEEIVKNVIFFVVESTVLDITKNLLVMEKNKVPEYYLFGMDVEDLNVECLDVVDLGLDKKFLKFIGVFFLVHYTKSQKSGSSSLREGVLTLNFSKHHLKIEDKDWAKEIFMLNLNAEDAENEGLSNPISTISTMFSTIPAMLPSSSSLEEPHSHKNEEDRIEVIGREEDFFH